MPRNTSIFQETERIILSLGSVLSSLIAVLVSYFFHSVFGLIISLILATASIFVRYYVQSPTSLITNLRNQTLDVMSASIAVSYFLLVTIALKLFIIQSLFTNLRIIANIDSGNYLASRFILVFVSISIVSLADLLRFRSSTLKNYLVQFNTVTRKNYLLTLNSLGFGVILIGFLSTDIMLLLNSFLAVISFLNFFLYPAGSKGHKKRNNLIALIEHLDIERSISEMSIRPSEKRLANLYVVLAIWFSLPLLIYSYFINIYSQTLLNTITYLILLLPPVLVLRIGKLNDGRITEDSLKTLYHIIFIFMLPLLVAVLLILDYMGWFYLPSYVLLSLGGFDGYWLLKPFAWYEIIIDLSIYGYFLLLMFIRVHSFTNSEKTQRKWGTEGLRKSSMELIIIISGGFLSFFTFELKASVTETLLTFATFFCTAFVVQLLRKKYNEILLNGYSNT